MEKLIKLLNEYCKEKKYNTVWYEKGGLLKFEPTKRLTQGVISGIVISKHYGFIERLVENDKIKEEEFSWFLYGPDYISDLSDAIIAWLSISETPIEDLICLLK